MLDIIIPTCANKEGIQRCLKSIKKNTKDYRVIVVKNGADYDVEADLVLEVPERIGFIKATNIGIAASTAPYLCLMNDDVVVTEKWAERLIDLISESDEYMLVSPITNYGTKNVDTQTVEKFIDIKYPEQKGSVEDYAKKVWEIGGETAAVAADMVPFFCSMLKRSTIEQIGYLCEEFGDGMGDDDDYCTRIQYEKGLVLIHLGVFVHHDQSVTLRQFHSKESFQKKLDSSKKILERKYPLKYIEKLV